MLNPDKGNGVVILDKNDYNNSMDNLFSHRSKFRVLSEDPTNSRLETLRNYLYKLHDRGELDDAKYKRVFPKHAKIGRAHGTAKIHKEFETVPPIRPIIDTIGSTHYNVGKFISELLQPLTLNNYHLKDSFETADRIKSIPAELFADGYRFVSFNVKSLFTNVPLKRTIDVILDRCYKQNLISTTLTKRTLKKLIIATCSATAFTSNGKIYEQIDGVSMGASLGPVLANIIMTELELKIVDRLIREGSIKFYCRYVDDTLLLVKPGDIDIIVSKFNGFDKNIQFTVDKFENGTPHFLDLEIHDDGLTIYRKETHTGQFTNFDSFLNWNYKISWIRALISRAIKLCSHNKLADEILKIKTFCSFNGFPRWTVNRLVKRFSAPHSERSLNAEQQNDATTLFMSLPYLGNDAEQIIRNMKRKLYRVFKEPKNVRFHIKLKSSRLSFFTSNKEKIPFLSKSQVVYEYQCPGCAHKYIGKTDTILFRRTKQHGWTQKDSAIYKHFSRCQPYQEIIDMFETDGSQIDNKEFQINAVRDNFKILYLCDNWLQLCFMESLVIKEFKPQLNVGMKATKEPQLY